MAQTIQANIGFVSPSSGASPHIESFKALVPEEVQMDIDGLGFVRTLLNDLKGKTGAVIEKVKELVKTKGWQGICASGAHEPGTGRRTPRSHQSTGGNSTGILCDCPEGLLCEAGSFDDTL